MRSRRAHHPTPSISLSDARSLDATFACNVTYIAFQHPPANASPLTSSPSPHHSSSDVSLVSTQSANSSSSSSSTSLPAPAPSPSPSPHATPAFTSVTIPSNRILPHPPQPRPSLPSPTNARMQHDASSTDHLSPPVQHRVVHVPSPNHHPVPPTKSVLTTLAHLNLSPNTSQRASISSSSSSQDMSAASLPTLSKPADESHLLGAWASTAICGNDITSSCLYATGLCIADAGVFAPIILILVAVTLYLFRSVYGEAVTALPLKYTHPHHAYPSAYATAQSC